MKNAFLIILGLILGSGVTFFATKIQKETVQILNTPKDKSSLDDAENLEAKIEQINELPSTPRLEFDGKTEELFGECSPEKEIQVINERYLCNQRPLKAKKHWTLMKKAEKEALSLLRSGDPQKIMEYTSCETHDLTWYEMVCEADRLKIHPSHYQNLFGYIKSLPDFKWSQTKWIKNRPDRRKIRNPRWILRSRLKSDAFRLLNPWFQTPHPTEHGTVILLEQKLDGKIYIVGIPVTGTINE